LEQTTINNKLMESNVFTQINELEIEENQNKQIIDFRLENRKQNIK